jgi:hypothetical protein
LPIASFDLPSSFLFIKILKLFYKEKNFSSHFRTLLAEKPASKEIRHASFWGIGD